MANLNLGNVCSKIGSGATPRGGKSSYLEDGPVALVRSQNVYNHGFETTGLAFINEEQAGRLDGVKVFAGDVLINITGDSVARVCLAPTWLGPARVNQHVAIVRPDPDVLDSKFLRYYLVTPRSQEHLLALASVGATRNALTKGMLEELDVAAPDITEQHEIAAILGALDDKIELNRKTAATLEEMARALYKSWFVDFDPVVAKSEGSPPAFMDAETAALFPDSFGDDGLPEGWTFSEAQTSLDISIGKTPPRKEPEHFTSYKDGVPWLSIKDMGNTGSYTGPTSEGLVQSSVDRFNVKIAPKGTTLLSFKLTVGRVRIASEDICTNEAIAHMKCRPESSVSNNFVFWYLKMFDFESLASTSSIATAVNSKTIKAMPFLLPDKDIVTAFDSIVDPTMKKLWQLVVENQTLAELRDTLLPKLMSGELRVGEAKEQVEDVA